MLSVSAALAAGMVLAPRHFRGQWLVEGALLLPMVLPWVALAVGMLAVVRATPLWGSPLSLAVGHAVLSLPVAYLVVRATLRQVDPHLEAAARGLGAGPRRGNRKRRRLPHLAAAGGPWVRIQPGNVEFDVRLCGHGEEAGNRDWALQILLRVVARVHERLLGSPG